ncbi:MAG: hypothetical protein JST01_23170 [Cyanobacteria bacterium SZAS TMP-1]|nr:hypothetical protein [Cyanobacteria bacterium SZAS TMP-1]
MKAALRLIVPSLVVASLGACSLPCLAASPGITVGGKSITLSAAQTKVIKSFKDLGVPVYFPTAVPGRFTLSSIKIDSMGDKDNPDYVIEFQDKKHHSFTVASAYSGIGDGPDGDRSLKGKSKIFGPFTIDVFKPGSEGNGGKTVYYLGSWMQDKHTAEAEKKQKLPLKDCRYVHFLGDGVSDSESLAIVESLMPVSSVH